MPLVLVDRYTRQQIQQNPDVLVVFGDNMDRVGYGGQAAAARDEPNAVGIPTLWSPGLFFSDQDFYEYPNIRKRIDEAFLKLFDHRLGDPCCSAIWWPTDGVGTGLAQLPVRAPTVLAYIEGWYAGLREVS